MSSKLNIRSLIGSFILIILAIVILTRTARDITFYFNKKVTSVNTPADAEKLHDNMVAEISLPLDFKNAYAVSYLSKREFLLIPFSGVGYKLMYVVEGPLSDKLIANLLPPLKGRVVTKDFGDEWEVYDQPMKLEKIFARDGITLPAGAMLIYDAPKELPNLWIFFLSGLSLVYLVYKVYWISRLFRGDKAPPQTATP